MRVTAAWIAGAKVDAERRRIVGTVLPYGEPGTATVNGDPAQLIFERGGLTWDDPNSVKLVVDHHGNRPILAGRARDLVDTADGIIGTFSVARTTVGNDVLVEAADGLRTGLSVECDIPHAAPGPDGTYRITADNPGRLFRVALVETPAFASAQVSEVAASSRKENAMPDTVNAAEVPDDQLTQVIGSLQDVTAALQAALPQPAGASEPAPAEAAHAGPAPALPVAPSHVTAATAVTREPFPYGHPGAAGTGFFRDLVYAAHEPEAGQRARTAQRMLVEAANEPVTKSNVWIPNEYAPGMYVEQLRFPRVITDALPSTPVSNPRPIVLPKFTSSAADGGSGEPVAAHSEGTNPAQAELVVGSTTVTPLPYSGLYDVNREALDGGAPGVDGIILTALLESYAQVTETAGMTAILGTSGITAPTSVPTNADLEVEARAMAKQIRSEMAAFEARRGLPPDRVLFATDVWSSALSADSTSTSGTPLYPYYSPTNMAAQVSAPAGFRLNVYGIEGRQAFKMTAAKVLQLVNADCHVWESPTLTFRWEEVAGPAKIRLVAFGYFVAACLQPKGVTLHTQL